MTPAQIADAQKLTREREPEARTVVSVRPHRLSEKDCQQARQREAENKY
jgi:hypothetical protein